MKLLAFTAGLAAGIAFTLHALNTSIRNGTFTRQLVNATDKARATQAAATAPRVIP